MAIPNPSRFPAERAANPALVMLAIDSSSSILSGAPEISFATLATILPVGEPVPEYPITSQASPIPLGMSTVLIDHSLDPSGVSRLVSKTCLVPGTSEPETTTHPPRALVAVSVGLALPFWAVASAE